MLKIFGEVFDFRGDHNYAKIRLHNLVLATVGWAMQNDPAFVAFLIQNHHVIASAIPYFLM